ncbi:MAG: hypothetical protein IJ313_07325, partial [Clostridia bacterium]|nr:hypothetical protein [Clostridia bacterium]
MDTRPIKDTDGAVQTDAVYCREDYTKKRRLGLLIALLVLLAIPVAAFMSAHLPQEDEAVSRIKHLMAVSEDMGLPVGGLMEIESAWDIEDTREESETPLVDRMYNDGAVLGYDREWNTFYCSLGMDGGDEWPTVSLTA